jgi:hypothetical protein
MFYDTQRRKKGLACNKRASAKATHPQGSTHAHKHVCMQVQHCSVLTCMHACTHALLARVEQRMQECTCVRMQLQHTSVEQGALHTQP